MDGPWGKARALLVVIPLFFVGPAHPPSRSPRLLFAFAAFAVPPLPFSAAAARDSAPQRPFRTVVRGGCVLDGRPDSDLSLASPRAEGNSLRTPPRRPDAFRLLGEGDRPVLGDLGPVSASTVVGCLDRGGRGPAVSAAGSEGDRLATLAVPGAIPRPTGRCGSANF